MVEELDKADTIEMLLETCLKQRREIKELKEGEARRKQRYIQVSQSFDYVETDPVNLDAVVSFKQALQLSAYSGKSFVSLGKPGIAEAIIESGPLGLVVTIPSGTDTTRREFDRWRRRLPAKPS